MKPPICALCAKRFDPLPASRPGLGGRGGLVRFADHRSLPDGMTGHPKGADWFCPRHFRAAQTYQDRPLSEALRALRQKRRHGRVLRLVAIVAALLVSATAWNVIGPLSLEEVDERYAVRMVEGSLDAEMIDRAAALLCAQWVEEKARPVWDPFRILWHQLWYNAWTEGYELVLWIEPEPMDLSLREFAIYQSGRTVFLRLEFEGRNRVLHTSFNAVELEQALAPFLFDAPPEVPPEY